jgi:outer membrane murein-binding lipoprotein Lpp
MRVHHAIAVVLLSVFLSGCAMNQDAQRLASDPLFSSAAQQLASDFLDGQKAGDGEQVAQAKYGVSDTFYNLVDYRIEGVGQQFGSPVVFVRVKAGNQMGGVIWTGYIIWLRHDPNLEASGDRYLGLRISYMAQGDAPSS